MRTGGAAAPRLKKGRSCNDSCSGARRTCPGRGEPRKVDLVFLCTPRPRPSTVPASHRQTMAWHATRTTADTYLSEAKKQVRILPLRRRPPRRRRGR